MTKKKSMSKRNFRHSTCNMSLGWNANLTLRQRHKSQHGRHLFTAIFVLVAMLRRQRYYGCLTKKVISWIVYSTRWKALQRSLYMLSIGLEASTAPVHWSCFWKFSKQCWRRSFCWDSFPGWVRIFKQPKTCTNFISSAWPVSFSISREFSRFSMWVCDDWASLWCFSLLVFCSCSCFSSFSIRAVDNSLLASCSCNCFSSFCVRAVDNSLNVFCFCNCFSSSCWSFSMVAFCLWNSSSKLSNFALDTWAGPRNWNCFSSIVMFPSCASICVSKL